MTVVDKRKVTVLEMFTGTQFTVKYTGRLLGLITDKQYAALLEDKRLWRKLFSVSTNAVSAITKLGVDIKGKRLALAVKEINNKVITSQKIVITDRLDIICHQINENEITLSTDNEEYFMLEDKEVD